MEQLHFFTAQDNAQMLDDVYQLRHESFNTRLGWEVKSCDGREFDQFDHEDTRYIALTDHNDGLVGCWRALPTLGDYMLKNIFPELLQGEALPQQEGIWEISRFTINKNKGKEGQPLCGRSTAHLVKSFYDFAVENDIHAYVTVTTVACERMLKRLGVSMHRLGAGKAIQIGIEQTVALHIEVNEHLNIHFA